MKFPSFRQIGPLCLGSLKSLQYNEPLRLAGATAFFTTFALPPILIILIQLLGLIFNRKSIGDHLLEHLADVVGQQSVDQIKEVLEGFRQLADNWLITIGGFVFLIFIATTLFKVIRDSLNQLWNIKPKPNARFRMRMLARGKSMIVIVSSAVLFLAVLLAEGMYSLLRDYFNEIWSGSSMVFAIINQIGSVVIVTIWFGVLFKFLPDADPSWNVILVGALFTGILFTFGKLLLGWLLRLSSVSTVYGASGSLVLLLLFVFYSSFILYYGAMFTYIWSEHSQQRIRPRRNAYRYEVVEQRKDS